MLTVLTIALTFMQLFLPSWLGIVVLLLQIVLPDAIPTIDEALSASILLVRILYIAIQNRHKRSY